MPIYVIAFIIAGASLLVWGLGALSLLVLGARWPEAWRWPSTMFHLPDDLVTLPDWANCWVVGDGWDIHPASEVVLSDGSMVYLDERGAKIPMYNKDVAYPDAGDNGGYWIVLIIVLMAACMLWAGWGV